MKRLLKILMGLMILSLVARSGNAWLPGTHTWICNQAGLSQYDCNQADDAAYQEKNIEIKGVKPHLCINDSDSCLARTLANKWYSLNTNVSLNLWADSMSPVRHQRFDNLDCVDVFEDCVDTNLRFGNTEWTCELECAVINPPTEEKIVNKADYSYMIKIAEYVKKQYNLQKLKHNVIKFGILALSIFGLVYMARSVGKKSK